MLVAKLVQMEGWVRHAMLAQNSQVALKATRGTRGALANILWTNSMSK